MKERVVIEMSSKLKRKLRIHKIVFGFKTLEQLVTFYASMADKAIEEIKKDRDLEELIETIEKTKTTKEV